MVSVCCISRNVGLFTAGDLATDRLLLVAHLHLHHDEAQLLGSSRSTSYTKGDRGEGPWEASGLSAVTAARNPISTAKDIVLQVKWTSSEGDGATETLKRKPVCNFATFKRWVVKVFRMTVKKETLTATTVVIDGPQDDESTVGNDADWQAALRDARAILTERDIITIYYNSELMPGARRNWMNQGHSRDLYYHGHKIDRMGRLQYYQPPIARRERLSFDHKHATHAPARAGHTVVVATYSQLQAIEYGKKEQGECDRLMRIILNEGQCIRKCDETRQAAISFS